MGKRLGKVIAPGEEQFCSDFYRVCYVWFLFLLLDGLIWNVLCIIVLFGESQLHNQ